MTRVPLVRRPLLALSACFGLAILLASCGDGESTGPAAGVTAAATSRAADATTEPKLTMPASRYVPNLDDLGKDAATGNAAFMTDLEATFVLDAQNYSGTKSFASKADGQKLLAGWGYLGGYETGFIPEGRETAVLNGSYYGVVEAHLFESSDGAKRAYDYFAAKLRDAGIAQPLTGGAVGNQSSAWTLTQGKVANSSVNRVYHQLVFRRGNLVAVLLTSGAEGFMKVDTILALASIVDEKALGTRAAPEPTPIPTRAAAGR